MSKRDWRVQPPYLHEPYASTVQRSPRKPLVPLEPSLSELTGPAFGEDAVHPDDADLTRIPGRYRRGHRPAHLRHRSCPGGRGPAGRRTRWSRCGRRMRPAATFTRPTTMMRRSIRISPAAGRCMTDARGEYRFTTIHPGAYPWTNHPNAWRPAHIHFSLFGTAFISRLVTQMYFPGDPLLPLDPVLGGVPEQAPAAADLALRPRRHRAGPRARLPVRHRASRPEPDADGDAVMAGARQTPSQTVGPFFGVGLTRPSRRSTCW